MFAVLLEASIARDRGCWFRSNQNTSAEKGIKCPDWPQRCLVMGHDSCLRDARIGTCQEVNQEISWIHSVVGVFGSIPESMSICRRTASLPSCLSVQALG